MTEASINLAIQVLTESGVIVRGADGNLSFVKEAKKAVTKVEPKKLTPQQTVIRYFKEAKGVNANDADWDRKHWNGRLGKDANAILKAFDGDAIKAGRYILIKSEEWADLPDWGLNGVAAAAGRDPRVNGGEENGREDKPLEPVMLDGRGRNRGTTSSGEIAGDALRYIEHSAVRTEGDGHMDGPGDYFGGDD